MRYFRWGFWALLITLSTAAHAETALPVGCFPPDVMTESLLMNGYIPIATMDVDKLPAVLWVNPRSQEYIVFVLNKDVLCEAGSGRAFHLYEARKV